MAWMALGRFAGVIGFLALAALGSLLLRRLRAGDVSAAQALADRHGAPRVRTWSHHWPAPGGR